jgi:hypothetical protein
MSFTVDDSSHPVIQCYVTCAIDQASLNKLDKEIVIFNVFPSVKGIQKVRAICV